MKTFIALVAIVAVASAQYNGYQKPQQYSSHGSGEGDVPILRQASEVNPDGSYSYSYETGNGIAASETGVGGQVANGDAHWTAPDGTPVEFQYTADENGYQPTGSHIAPALARALEYIRTHPGNDDDYSGSAQTYNQKQPGGFGYGYNKRY